MNHITVQDLLTSWGKAKRELPSGHEAFKNTLLAQLAFDDAASQRPHAQRYPWLSFALTGLGLAVFLVTLAQTPGPISIPTVNVNEQKSTPPADSTSGERKTALDDYYYPTPPNAPITDTREFLKTDYDATIRTRRITDLAIRIQTIVRGSGGRIDGTSSSIKHGYVSFVVPASKFETFRNEMKVLVGERFFIENISTRNLIGEKRSIEDAQKQTEKTIGELRNERDELTSAHNRTIGSMQSSLNAITRELAILRAERTEDPQRQAQINARVSELVAAQRTWESRLASEHRTYNEQLAMLNDQIKTNESYLEGIKKQDASLIDTVATVEGTITLNWISLWEIVTLYVSPYWITALLLVAAVVSYTFHRRRLTSILLP